MAGYNIKALSERIGKMKRIIAAVSVLAVCCLMLVGCSDKNSDTENTKSADSISAENGSVTSADTDEKADDTTLAEAYTKSLADCDFRAVMVTSSDFMDDTTTVFEICGNDYHMSVGDDEEQTELYFIDGVVYVLSHAEKNYIKDDTPDEKYLHIDTQNYTMGVEDCFVYIGSEETEDGLICEIFKAPDLISGEMPTDGEDSNATIYRYYFEKGGKTPVKIGMEAYGMEQTTTFSEFSFDISSIEMPNLTGWTDDTESIEAEDDTKADEVENEVEEPNIDAVEAQAGETD